MDPPLSVREGTVSEEGLYKKLDRRMLDKMSILENIIDIRLSKIDEFNKEYSEELSEHFNDVSAKNFKKQNTQISTLYDRTNEIKDQYNTFCKDANKRMNKHHRENNLLYERGQLSSEELMDRLIKLLDKRL